MHFWCVCVCRCIKKCDAKAFASHGKSSNANYYLFIFPIHIECRKKGFEKENDRYGVRCIHSFICQFEFSCRYHLALVWRWHANTREIKACACRCMAMVPQIRVKCLRHTIWRTFGSCRAFLCARIIVMVNFPIFQTPAVQAANTCSRSHEHFSPFLPFIFNKGLWCLVNWLK